VSAAAVQAKLEVTDHMVLSVAMWEEAVGFQRSNDEAKLDMDDVMDHERHLAVEGAPFAR
jgi:hypothetical protein